MKTSKPDSRRSAKPSSAVNVDSYIENTPEPARTMLKQMRETIRSVAPADSTELIHYRMPAFKHDRVLLWFAAFSKHCSLFPTPRIIEAFKNELQDYTVSKGTVQFPLDKPLPVALIKKMVKARFAQGRS